MKTIIITQNWPEFQSGTWVCSEHGLVWLRKDAIRSLGETGGLCPLCTGAIKECGD